MSIPKTRCPACKGTGKFKYIFSNEERIGDCRGCYGKGVISLDNAATAKPNLERIIHLGPFTFPPNPINSINPNEDRLRPCGLSFDDMMSQLRGEQR